MILFLFLLYVGKLLEDATLIFVQKLIFKKLHIPKTLLDKVILDQFSLKTFLTRKISFIKLANWV